MKVLKLAIAVAVCITMGLASTLGNSVLGPWVWYPLCFVVGATVSHFLFAIKRSH